MIELKRNELKGNNFTFPMTFVEKKDKEESFPYHAIFIDADKREKFLSLLPSELYLCVVSLPEFKDEQDMIRYVIEISRDDQKNSLQSLLISEKQDLVIFAEHVGIDSCFVNNGYNDNIDYTTTYEVPDIKRLVRTK